jgi:hypothetical protein
VIPEFEVEPVNSRDTGPGYEKAGSATPPVPALPVRREGYCFWIDGRRLDLNSISGRYVELLLKLVSNYEERLTISY